jgi:hypothetical protein
VVHYGARASRGNFVPPGRSCGQVDAKPDQELRSGVDIIDHDIDLVDPRRTHMMHANSAPERRLWARRRASSDW